jgi:pimeloyl-ACP methyl ester carboxylesterase
MPVIASRASAFDRFHAGSGFKGPVITVPTITIASDFDGPAADGSSYREKFSGKYSHRIFSGIGHNVPQEAPQEFAKAVLDVAG